MKPLTERVLDYVNETRAKYKIGRGRPLKRLPKGHPIDACGCVIAKALHASVDGFDAALLGRDERIQLPADVQVFIMNFDAGEYPELLAK